ncbi:sensor histidine kinase [Paraburkholderia oxyphila]|uniref:sensor histidine kinase n=1 Tax=Paraburkholderia oxyphila TaxID=614212 RepID=UPI000489C9CA|nr:ATP-binding protein [Paraburkholderia oxyphila]
MKSLKNQITVALIALVAIVGVVDSLASYWLSRRQIGALLDVHLQGAAVWMAAGKVGAIGASGPPQHSVDGFVGQIWKRGLEQPTDDTDPEVLFDRAAPEGYSVERIGGNLYRIYTLRKNDGELTYQVGQPIAFREQTAGRTALQSLAPAFILIPLVLLAIPLIVNRAFASLVHAGAQAESVGIGRLKPLDIPDVPAEVRPFTDSINRMITRLRSGIEAEKRFIADAAHELRTPVTAMQLRVDNLARAPDESARAERMTELREAIARASTMIRQLLSLARADAQLDQASTEGVDLHGLIQKLVVDILPVAQARSIDLGAGRFEAAKVRAREGDLRMAVRNLLENALRYTPAGGAVDIDVYPSGADVVVRVTDSGPGIPEASLERVFDRFYRLHAADSDGSGLGLSIVKSVVRKYHGTISLQNRSDGHSGLIATIVLPTQHNGTALDAR